MESADLTPRSPAEDAALEALLREPAPMIPDAGFSQRVMNALPEKAAVKRSSGRTIVITIGALGGVAIALSKMESVTEIQSDWTAAGLALEQTAALLSNPNSIIVLSVAGVSAFYALVSAAPNRR